jgi:tetratricopeptide (TPR) repeat protein
MAVSYSTIGIYGPLSAREAGAKARDAASMAVQLDNELAEAHVALGVVKLLYEWDWEGARLEFERALKLNPNGEGHTPYGYYLYTMGRWDEALAELKRTSDLNPGWQTANWDIWWALYAARRFDQAERNCRQAIKLDPNDEGAYWILGQVQAQQHNYKEAIASFEKAVALNNSNLRYLADLGYARARAGEKNRALEIIAQLKKSPASLAPYSIAEIFVGLGDKDQAFVWLDKAFEERFPFLSDFRVTPQFDELRSDPRYSELAKRMNLSL